MGRSPCCDKNGLKKGPWTPEEDQKLIDYIHQHGYGNWRTLPKNAGLQRCGKSCRLRWTNYLRPDIKRGRFSFEEEETIIQLHSILGNKWSAIAGRLPGRTDNEIKNYWNTHIRKRLLRMGIDPVTHSPRLDLLDLSSILNSSFYNSSHQMNLSRLMGVQVQPFVNPELLRLATSLFSSQRNKSHLEHDDHHFPMQNRNVVVHQQNQFYHNTSATTTTSTPIHTHDHHHQLPPLVHPSQIPPPGNDLGTTCGTMSTTPCVVPFSSDEAQLNIEPNVENFPGNLNFSNLISSQGCELNEWQQGPGVLPPSNLMEDFVLPLQNYGYYDTVDHRPFFDTATDPSDTTTTSTFQSANSNNNFRFQSVLSTPTSSPTPLHSNSTYNNFNSGSTTTTATTNDQDEKEISYCSNMLTTFEIPDHLLDVNEFL